MLGFLIRVGNPTFDLCVRPWLVSFLPPICLMGNGVKGCSLCDGWLFICVCPSVIFPDQWNEHGIHWAWNSNAISLPKSLQNSVASVLDRYMMSCKLTLSYMSASGANWLPVIFVLSGALSYGLIHNFSKCPVLNATVVSHIAKWPTFST